MQVVYPVCCGIDVHKTFLIATIIKTNQDGLTPTIYHTNVTVPQEKPAQRAG